jgi:hypothetical protein
MLQLGWLTVPRVSFGPIAKWRAAVVCALVLTCWGCRSERDAATEKKLAELKLTPEEAKRLLLELSTKRAEHEPPRVTSEAPTSPRPASVPAASAEAHGLNSVAEAWVVDDLEDIGPAAPSSASAHGVFLVNGANELFLAKANPLPTTLDSRASSIGVIPDSKGPFALGRGPVFTLEYAYWVTSHYLLRRPTTAPYGPLEIIAEDARIGTRAAAVSLKGESAVAYIALPKVKDGPLRARLWLEKQAPKTAVDVTESGNSTLSVALVARKGDALALSLEARMGVTALHVRPIDLASGKLGEDDVPWIGGTAQPLTEVRALGKPDVAFTFLTMEQDSSHFGLAVLSQPTAPSPRGGASQVNEYWLTFPNGQDPAPVATTTACGKDLVLFARPSEAAPRAPQELVLAELTNGLLANPQVLSRARAYYDVSIAALNRGALVSFVADQRTWARTLRCRTR